MENGFILILSFLFLFIGIFQLNLLVILAGISMLLFLIYYNIYNGKKRKNYKVFPSSNFKLVGMLGKIDLILGGLLLVKATIGIIPNILIITLAFILGIKALPFIFKGDIASVIDIILVTIILLGVSQISSLILIIISIYLIQKGVLSLV